MKFVINGVVVVEIKSAVNVAIGGVLGFGFGKFGSRSLKEPSKYFDKESKLNYNWHRYYDPEIGRYIRSDPIGLDDGPSTYGYAHQNPIVNTDLLGLNATVCLYSGAGGFGHVGIGINTNKITEGYYPNSAASGNPITGQQGELVFDSGEQQSCKEVKTTEEQDVQMTLKMLSIMENPGTYTLTGNNCVNFVREVLKAGDVSSSDTIRPKPFFKDINKG